MNAPTEDAAASSPASTAEPHDSTQTNRSTTRVVALILTWLPAVMIGIGGWVHRWTDEDAFINFRIVDQVMAGHGPVFNAGERIETYTSTLWLALLVVGRTLFGWAMGLEWISVLLGLAAAVGAFLIAARASRAMHRPGEVVVPIGLIVVGAIPVMWDFATSGLEMSLVWLWIACCWWALTRVAATPELTGRARRWSLIALGLGPLVRPELGLMVIVFLIAWFLLAAPRRVFHDVAVAFAIPVAYQIFRMGYFASLVPSTALAKDSSGLHVSQGWQYFTDLVGTYALWIPFAVVLVVVVVRGLEFPERRRLIASGALLIAAGASAGYMIATGGDYMHGRLLLPAVFAAAVPASVGIDPTRWREHVVRRLVPVAVALVWAVVVIAGVRYPAPKQTFGLTDIADWRLVLHKQMFHTPDKGITIAPQAIHRNYENGWRGFMRVLDTKPRAGKDPNRLVVVLGSIGVPARVMGHDVYVVDIGGLAEPLAARTNPIPNRPAGHRKQVDDQWYDARFGVGGTDARTVAARAALRCQPIKGLLDGVTDPLTPGRFLSNLWHAPEYTLMKIPKNPIAAEKKFCPKK